MQGVVSVPMDLLPYALHHYEDNKHSGGYPLPLNKTFVMGPKDVVLSLIRTPPPVKYYSVRSYLTYRCVVVYSNEVLCA